MFKKIRIRKNKILFYYFLAIVFPSVVLGALAFRGVVNDQAINEREIRQQLTEAGSKIITEADLYLAKTEKQFFQNARSGRTLPTETIFFEDSVLTQFMTENPGIDGIFFILPNGRVQILKSELLYFPDRTFNQLNSNPESDLNKNLDKGWKFEFQDKNYQKALTFYQSFIKKTNDDALIASLLLSVARIQKKLLKSTDAINTYKLIEEKHGHQRMNGGIPLGVISLLETGKLYLSIKDTLNALKETNNLISETAKSHWELEVSQYNQVISACNEMMKETEPCKNEICNEQRIQLIKYLDILSIYADKTNQQLAFLNKAAIVVNESGFKSPEAECEYRVYTDVERKPTLLSVFPSSVMGQWGIIYNLTEFQNQLTRTIIPVETQKLGFQWQLLKDGRGILTQSPGDLSEDIRNTTVFPSYLPSWSLILCTESPDVITTFLKASQGIFIYIFLFIVILLALGLFFTLQIINKELLLSKMKSDFISTVSHEFKSPLTSIRQMTEMLFHERIKNESRKKEYYAVMLEQSERLSHLIDNILDFSKIEEGKKAFRFERTNLAELIEHVKSVFQRSIANEGLSVDLSIPETLPELLLDKEAIQQVIYNLLDNAYKYSGNSKEIKILAESIDGSVEISVRDFGIGIAPEDKHRIFERFYRGGKELTRSIKGSGIGLTVVKKIIEAHHGKISFESTPGAGSIFYIILPV